MSREGKQAIGKEPGLCIETRAGQWSVRSCELFLVGCGKCRDVFWVKSNNFPQQPHDGSPVMY